MFKPVKVSKFRKRQKKFYKEFDKENGNPQRRLSWNRAFKFRYEKGRWYHAN